MLIPASNDIKIKASKSNSDPNASTSDIPEYDVQIFTRYNQLVKKAKCPKGNGEVTIDVSSLASNQLYTVQLITKYRPLPIIKFLSHSIIKNKNSFFSKKQKQILRIFANSYNFSEYSLV